MYQMLWRRRYRYSQCDPCARVRPCVPCVPCVSRLPPVSFYRYKISNSFSALVDDVGIPTWFVFYEEVCAQMCDATRARRPASEIDGAHRATLYLQ